MISQCWSLENCDCWVGLPHKVKGWKWINDYHTSNICLKFLLKLFKFLKGIRIFYSMQTLPLLPKLSEHSCMWLKGHNHDNFRQWCILLWIGSCKLHVGCATVHHQDKGNCNKWISFSSIINETLLQICKIWPIGKYFLSLPKCKKKLMFFAHPCSSLAFLCLKWWDLTEVWKLLLWNFNSIHISSVLKLCKIPWPSFFNYFLICHHRLGWI